MITYELAKQLKDNGFPQFHLGLGVLGDHPYGAESICYPDLKELIEACGDRFWKLILEDGEWLAYGGRSTRYIRGTTPEEAVCNLYLELNKK